MNILARVEKTLTEEAIAITQLHCMEDSPLKNNPSGLGSVAKT